MKWEFDFTRTMVADDEEDAAEGSDNRQPAQEAAWLGVARERVAMATESFLYPSLRPSPSQT